MADQIWSGEYAGAALPFGGELDVLFTNDLGPQPAAHTVMLAAEKTDAFNPLVLPQLPAYHAECLVKAGQYSAKFRCDWRGQFSAVFQSLQVRLVSYEPWIMDASSYGQPDGRFRHSALVGYGGWNAARPLTYTTQQRTLVDSGAGDRCHIMVPRFGRRFYPRLLHYTSSTFDTSVQSAPLNPAMLGGIQISLDLGDGSGAYSGVLTEQMLLEGIDVLGASVVTLKPLTAAAGAHLVTPVFELAL